MIIDPLKIPSRDAYQLLISSVVPRPIAWVSTIAPDGTYNLAPYSFFMGITGDPPMLAVSCNWRVRAGIKKDTLSNVEASGEFVVNLSTEETAEQMNQSSAEWGPEVDEFEQTGLTPLPSQLVRAPRVAESPVNIECKVNQILILGREDSRTRTGLIIGEAIMWHVRDDLLTPENTVDVAKLQAIGRLSYSNYTRTRDLFQMVRPVV